MQYAECSEKFRSVLGLRVSPVAVTYSDEPAKSAVEGRWRVCGAIQDASRGAVINLTAQNSLCGGGTSYLGLAERPPEQRKPLMEFLVKGEKLFANPIAVHRMFALSKAPPPKNIADYVIFAPLEKAEQEPNLVVFICNAGQAARLINLAYYSDGKPMECDPTGALCQSVITYPLVTGKVNVSFGDVTARRAQKYADDELFVSLPWAIFLSALDSLDKCSAGTAKSEIPASFREAAQASGEELPPL
jgi:uncharacterized protein (DUF169 family)